MALQRGIVIDFMQVKLFTFKIIILTDDMLEQIRIHLFILHEFAFQISKASSDVESLRKMLQKVVAQMKVRFIYRIRRNTLLYFMIFVFR